MVPIYFSGSISGGRDDVETYIRLVEIVRSFGYEVNAGQVTNPDLPAGGEAGDAGFIFERDMAWLEDVADARGILLAEVSTPSLGVGYEIAAARYLHGIAVVCLYRERPGRRCSAMIEGDREIRLIRYSPDDLEALIPPLRRALEEAERERSPGE